jgi:Ni/Fe-hydrogenase subunit HybB-like protein
MKGRISSPGMTEVLISAGFLGAMALTVILFLRTFPLLPVSDPLFCEKFTASPAETEGTGT